MSKKLIAVAAAAALALTGLVAAPANATTITGVSIWTTEDLSAAGAATDSHSGTTSVSATTYAASRTVDFNATGDTTRTAVRFVVTTSAATTVTISSTSGVKISESPNDADGKALSVTSGSQSLAIITTANKLTAEFYAWNTSTTAGKVSISTPGSLNTYNVKGTLGTAYNIQNVKFPTSVLSGSTIANSKSIISFDVTDAYGNKLDTPNIGTVAVEAFGANNTPATYNTTRKQYEAIVFGTAADNVAMSVTLTADDLSDNGFAKPVTYAFSASVGADLATQVATLTAQVAALQAQLAASRTKANSVTKKRWNKLVRAHRALGGTAKLK
jgi:hypothetical protein